MYDRAYWQAAEYIADQPEDQPVTQVCEMPGCAEAGLFKAPKSPTELRSYRWFCQPHVQEYNKAWNYFSGYNTAEMEKVRREDVVGWRPTWPLGHIHGDAGSMDVVGLKKHIFQHFFGARAAKAAAVKQPHANLSAEEKQALARFGLKWPTSIYEVKTRYRVLVKQYHPDALAGEKENAVAGEAIKDINRAYGVLKRRLAKRE